MVAFLNWGRWCLSRKLVEISVYWVQYRHKTLRIITNFQVQKIIFHTDFTIKNSLKVHSLLLCLSSWKNGCCLYCVMIFYNNLFWHICRNLTQYEKIFWFSYKKVFSLFHVVCKNSDIFDLKKLKEKKTIQKKMCEALPCECCWVNCCGEVNGFAKLAMCFGFWMCKNDRLKSYSPQCCYCL